VKIDFNFDLKNIERILKATKKEASIEIGASGSGLSPEGKSVRNVEKLRKNYRKRKNILLYSKNAPSNKKLSEKFLEMIMKGVSVSKVLVQVGEGIIIPEIIKNWLSGKGADGKPMAPLSPDYAEYKVNELKRKGIPDMNVTGNLQSSLRVKKK